ncbi:hypothetical protein, partial [Propionivibrio sp.]|uniref:hypothetical protein n=1 Tax=Propionivibrio sp. TaxID=2212460 RepID=UPI0025E35B69
MGISPDSGGNVPVTCHSAENYVEGQLADRVNSHYRPKAEVARPEKRSFRNAVKMTISNRSDQDQIEQLIESKRALTGRKNWYL